NYHGSGNYGLRWVESIKGRYYELEVPDIVAGVDTLVARGIAHPDSLALAGWSNGSILSIMTAIEHARFKAVLAGAGDVNWTSDYGNCAFGAGFDNAYFGGPPWELPEVYLEKSPLFRMDETTAPTLIMFGAADTNVPTAQGWEHFRALQQIGKAPVRFILFPGSQHGLRSPVQQKRKIEEELAWLERHLFGRPAPEDRLLCGKSPLGLALRRAGAARSGGLFGRDEEGTLVPETVPLAGLHVGRFEVTRAQLAASRGDAAPPGEGNLPAAGVTFEEAKGYCAWLSEQTGRRFRLPTVAEAGRLAAAAKGNLSRENNLERWLDRTPTPDELPALRRKIAALEKTRLLVEPVGSFGPIPESWVYDLGGNVFEWAVGEDGVGALTGLAAISSRDPRVRERERDPRYAGFRVIEER
ncbi:MAG TPA: peptidase S9, partial [Alphaproteobacteria bacterium]|nr:peptidase S9 [Alphaproteobacteria bacterium]